MRQIFHHGEIVRDEQIGHPQLGLQCLEQIEDLRLHRHIEGRGRLVADQQFRLHGEGAGNGDALALPAGKFVRITSCRFVRQTNLFQQREHRIVLPARIGIQRRHAFGNDFTDPHARIERGERVLEHHLHVPPCRPQTLRLHADQFGIGDANAARRRLDQLEQGLADRGLAATGFADQGQRAPR